MRFLVFARLVAVGASVFMNLPAIKSASNSARKVNTRGGSSKKKQHLPAVSDAVLDDDRGDGGLVVLGYAPRSALAAETGVNNRSTVRWQELQVGGGGPINDATTTTTMMMSPVATSTAARRQQTTTTTTRKRTAFVSPTTLMKHRSPASSLKKKTPRTKRARGAAMKTPTALFTSQSENKPPKGSSSVRGAWRRTPAGGSSATVAGQ
jgi:hypothetical protein